MHFVKKKKKYNDNNQSISNKMAEKMTTLRRQMTKLTRQNIIIDQPSKQKKTKEKEKEREFKLVSSLSKVRNEKKERNKKRVESIRIDYD